IAALLIGLGASGEALAQYYPSAQPYPPPQAYPPPQGYPPHRAPVADADDNQLYDLQGRPIPPAAVGPQATEPPAPAPQHDPARPATPAEARAPPPPAPSREPQQQGSRKLPPQGSNGYEPAAAGTRPYYGSPNPSYASPPAGAPYEPDATRPPLPIS